MIPCVFFSGVTLALDSDSDSDDDEAQISDMDRLKSLQEESFRQRNGDSSDDEEDQDSQEDEEVAMLP